MTGSNPSHGLQLPNPTPPTNTIFVRGSQSSMKGHLGKKYHDLAIPDEFVGGYSDEKIGCGNGQASMRNQDGEVTFVS